MLHLESAAQAAVMSSDYEQRLTGGGEIYQTTEAMHYMHPQAYYGYNSPATSTHPPGIVV